MPLDIFLSIPGIPGESTDIAFKGTIITPGYALSLASPPSHSVNGQLYPGKAVFAPLQIQKLVDKSSPRLMQFLAQSKKIASMTLLLREASRKPSPSAAYLIYQFQTVVITDIEESGFVGGDDAPFEAVTFAFGIYQLRYRTTSPDGSLNSVITTSAWNELTNSLPKNPAPR